MTRSFSNGTIPGLSLFFLVAPATPLFASSTSLPAPGLQPGVASSDAVGLTEDAGEIVGAGRNYKVFFRPGGIEFHPALGARAPRNLPLSIAFESVGRGESVMTSQASAPEISGASQVSFRHGASIVERYDLRGDGVEQSFVVTHAPAGQGDLRLRLRIATELPRVAACAGSGLRFEIENLGGVSIGGVTGIDADGRRCAGSVRCEGDVLELGLPAAFVEGARFPLIVDPLISTSGLVAATEDVRRPDVAFDRATTRWLVTWDTTFSAADVDVRARLLTDPGSLAGSLILLETSTSSYAFRPVTANVGLSDSFLVVWQEGGPEQSPPSTPWLRGRVVNPTTAATSLLATFWINASAPDLAGDSSEVDDDAVMVFQNHNASDIRAALVRVPVTGMPVMHTSFILPTDGTDSEPAISKHGGSSRRYALVWSHRYSVVDRDIEAVLLSPQTGVISSKVTISDSGKDEERPRVDGNGVNFAFAWQRQQSVGDHDIALRRATWHDTSVTYSSETLLAPGVGTDEVDVDLVYCGPKYVVAWSEQINGTDYDLYMTGVEPTTLAQAEPVSAVGPGLLVADRAVALSSHLASGATGDTAMMTWNALGFGLYTPMIQIQLAEAVGDGGPVIDLGGGCGAGGTSTYNGPVAVGNFQFKAVLLGASPAATTSIFNLSLPGTTYTCGPCVWNPYFLTVNVPLVGGNASLGLPIPVDMALGGITFETQWNVLQSGVTPCLKGPGLSLSNRLRITIGY